MRYINKYNFIQINIILCLIFISIFGCSEKIVEEKLMSCQGLVHYIGVTTYENKPFTGSCIVYNNAGVKERLLSYKKGVSNGVHKGYYDDGSIEYEGYRKKNEIHGKYIKYNIQGNIIVQGRFKRGYYDGRWKYFDDKGNLTMEKKFLNKKLIDSIIY